MATHHGLLELPVQTPAAGEAAGDPAITIVADFLKAVINAKATTAWQTSGVSPPDATAPTPGRDLPVNGLHTHDPEDESFTENDLPALYVFRSGSQGSRGFEDMAEDYQVDRTTFIVWWVYRRALQANRAARAPFVNAVAKIIYRAIDTCRDPAYVGTGDTDPLAPSHQADPDSIKSTIATATSAQTYSGAALNGAIGATEMTLPRSPTVTATGPSGAFVPGSLVTWRGVNDIDVEVEVATEIAGPGLYDANYEFKRIDEIEVEAQASTGGTFQFGTAVRAGLGTDVLEAGSFLSLRATRWTPKTITIQVKGGERVFSYDVLETQIEAEEQLIEPLEDFDSLDDDGAGAEVTFVREDDATHQTAFYD